MRKRNSFRKLIGQSKVDLVLVSSLWTVACTGQLGLLATTEGDSSGSSQSAGDGDTGADSDGRLPLSTDPGFKGMHRLNSREYDNTVRDLFGTSVKPGDGFLNESGHGFDNMAASLGMTANQYAAYFRAASDVAADVMANPTLAEQVLVCVPSAAVDMACASQTVEAVGLRVFRRPMRPEEVTTYLGVYERATALELDHNAAIGEVLRALLSSAEFLYRIEFDEDPASFQPHPVSDYELASRLSYFLWSSTPDEELLSVAREGVLSESAILDAQVDRLLSQTDRSDALVDSFAWQWLGLERLESHAVLTDAYPEWNDELRGALLEEARVYLSTFFQEERSWNDFLTSDFAYEDPVLDAHYEGQGERMGFLGLGAFLTLSSFSHRTSPTLRAMWILEELLCSPPPPPPANVEIPDLDADELANAAAEIENVRARLELHRSDPGCANCHAALDPLGMALENFDAIGRYRGAYENGDPVDPTGEMPDGTAFDGLPSLALSLAEDERFFDCTTEKALTYALGRGLEEEDKSHEQDIRHRWEESGDLTFHNLVKTLIHSTPFLERRGGSE